MRGADGVKTAVLRKGRAKLAFIWAAAHARVSTLPLCKDLLLVLFPRNNGAVDETMGQVPLCALSVRTRDGTP